MVSPPISYSAERADHAPGRGLAVDVPDDQLGDHRVVQRQHLVALAGAGVHPHAGARRLHVVGDLARGGGEVGGRGLRVDAALDGVAAQLDVLLGEGQVLARGDLDLLAHDVDAGDHLGHAVLDLHAGVHLQEEVLAIVGEQALDRAGGEVADGLGGVGSDLADLLAQLGVDGGGGALLDQLLVAALDRAVALEQVHGVAGLVGQHLDLHVARVGQVALQVDRGVGEELLALAGGALERVLELGLLQGHAEALAATAAGGLDGHGVADLVVDQLLGVLDRLDRVGGAGHDGHAGVLHQLARLGLRAHGVDGARGRADERDAGLVAGAHERRVLGQEPVAGVDGLGPRLLRHLEDLLDVQVALGRRAAAQQVRLVGALDVGRVAIGLGVDGHRRDTQLLEGAHDPDGDLSTVGYEDLGEHAAREDIHRGSP